MQGVKLCTLVPYSPVAMSLRSHGWFFIGKPAGGGVRGLGVGVGARRVGVGGGWALWDSIVYIAISSGLQSEKTCTDHR